MTARPTVDGSVRPGWEAVRDAFTQGQAYDPGHAQLAVHHHGRLVVDLWSTGATGIGAAGPAATDAAAPARRALGAGSGGVRLWVSKAQVAVSAQQLC
ncbi:hypothetical protein ACFWFI_00510, partial [Streptomyces sp. NPDC060209]